jgi:hypothetical protein
MVTGNTAAEPEMIVFISYENEFPEGGTPEETGRDLVQALGIERAEYGVDLMTGGCEVRIPYDEGHLANIRAWLAERNILHDISFVGGRRER